MTVPTDSVAGADTVGWRFDNTYARLPEPFHAPAKPATVRKAGLSILNHALADELGLDFQSTTPEAAAALFAGQALPAGAQPIAQAYAGHQFGHFTMLGDGRAILWGEHRTPAGPLVDLQFKGSGRTRFSRSGDGLAVLGPMLREYIISEAMAALGIPTTRSLAVVTTGQFIYRDGIKPGAILTRVAASHLRVGTFQYAAALDDPSLLRTLVDYAIDRHDPELAAEPEKHLLFLRAVADRQAQLIACWQHVGFIHGVMNTDNMALSGQTIDYGPCAFMNTYDPETVYSSIDRAGRYAYGNQPTIARWNLARLAETLLPLIHPEPKQAIALATGVIDDFPSQFETYWLAGMRDKLGLRTEEPGDLELVNTLLDLMHRSRLDFTNTFRDLSSDSLPIAEPYPSPEFQAWHTRWRDRQAREPFSPLEIAAFMRSINPAIIPRNHKVEEALSAAEDQNDLTPLHALLEALTTPFTPAPRHAPYQNPQPDDPTYRTFCGT